MKPYKKFQRKEHLECWLRDTTEGQEIVQSVLDESVYRERANHVLAVVHHDCVEVYGSDNVRFTQVEQLHTSAAGEVLAEELVDLSLPLAYRELHTPRYRKALLFPRSVRPSEYRYRHWWWGLVKGVLGASQIKKTSRAAADA